MDVPEVDCSQAAAMRDAGAAWIDVREQDEWDHAHIEGTLHIPLAEAAEQVPARYPDKGATIILSCHSGARSGRLVAHLRNAGYLDVHNLRGGIVDWANEGRAIVTVR